MPEADSNVAEAPSPASPDGADTPPPGGRLSAAAVELLLAAELFPLSPGVRDLGALQARLDEDVRVFQQRAASLDLDPEVIDTARYALCALLDETLLASPWGARGWGHFSLLRRYYGESFGGGRVFRELETLLEAETPSTELIELFHLCLTLGFRGRFLDPAPPAARIQLWRRSLAQRLPTREAEPDNAPSPAAPDDQPDCFPPPRRRAPLWLIGALSGLLLLFMYHGFRVIANQAAAPVVVELRLIAPNAPAR